MENFSLDATKHTPAVSIDYNQGLIEIRGRAQLKDVQTFYESVSKAIPYFVNHLSKIFISVHLSWFNSAGIRAVYLILNEFHRLQRQGVQIEIQWQYQIDDVNAMEVGKDLQQLTSLNFSLNPIAS